MTKKSKSRRRRKHRTKEREDAAVSPVTKYEEQMGVRIAASAEDDLLEEAIKLAAAEKKEIEALAAAEKKEIEALEAKMNCKHGYETDEYIERFYLAFEKALVGALTGTGLDDGLELFEVVHMATASQFADVWSDSTKIAKVVQYLASYGTTLILEGNKQRADVFASFANYFEQFAKVNVDNTQAVLHVNKLFELCKGDDHTLTSFYRRRIPCSCLDDIYKEVKLIKKKGFCWNTDCNHSFEAGVNESKWKLDRSSLMSCSRCRHACYCSVECQKADWPRHKSDCDKAVARTVAFEEGKCYRAT